MPREGHVLFADAGEGLSHLAGIGLGLGRNCHAVQRGWIFTRSDCDLVGLVSQGLTGTGFTQFEHHADIAGVQVFDWKVFLAHRHAQVTHALFFILLDVPHPGVALDHAGENLEVSDLADEWVGGGLPDICGQRAGVLRFQLDLALGALAGLSRRVSRRGQQRNDQVEQLGQADLAVDVGEQHGSKLALLHHAAQALFDLGRGQFAAF